MKTELFYRAAIIFTAAILMALLAGCGHNVITYGDGIKAEVGLIPEEYKLSATFWYGKILSVCVRENTEIEMQGAGSGNAGTDGKQAGASGTGSVKIKVGPQVTGYYVDALKAGAKPEDLKKHIEK